METLTTDEFKKKYGVIAASQFDSSKKEESLFESIKNDLAQRAQTNENILNQPNLGPADTVARGFEIAGNTAGGVGATVGNVLHKVPLVGPALDAVGGALKGGFNAITDKLAGTKFFQEAAGGLQPGNATEAGLRIASGGGEVASNIVGADLGAGGVKNAAEVGSKIPSQVGEHIPTPPPGAAGAAAKYVQGAIKDVVPTTQSLIDHNLAKALDLTPGDMSNLAKSTGNEVGTWMSKYNLIGTNKANTLGLIQSFFKTNYDGVRAEIGKVTDVYKPSQVPYFTDTLKSLGAEVQGKIGLEDTFKEIQTLLKKKEVTLSDVQRVKELLDEHYSLYKVTGDVQAGVVKQGLANVRQDIKNFIENQVKEKTGADIREMNNNVATSRSLADAIETRTPRGLTRANITWRDFAVGAGLTYFSSPVVGLAAILIKKVVTSPTFRLRFARYLDALNDAQRAKISQSLKNGEVPPEVIKVVGPLNEQP